MEYSQNVDNVDVDFEIEILKGRCRDSNVTIVGEDHRARAPWLLPFVEQLMDGVYPNAVILVEARPDEADTGGHLLHPDSVSPVGFFSSCVWSGFIFKHGVTVIPYDYRIEGVGSVLREAPYYPKPADQEWFDRLETMWYIQMSRASDIVPPTHFQLVNELLAELQTKIGKEEDLDPIMETMMNLWSQIAEYGLQYHVDRATRERDIARPIYIFMGIDHVSDAVVVLEDHVQLCASLNAVDSL